VTTGAVRAPLAALDRAPDWLNSEPLSAAALRGKVVAVQFCTYSCVNWIRTLPYVRAWASAYADRGLVVIGAHTPEFVFEREPGGVRTALRRLEVTYPVVLDSGYALWDAFANRYWPALYVAGADGHIRHQHFGEGAYEETEAAIRDLLGVHDVPPVDIEPTGLEAPADWEALGSPETYLGYARGERRAPDADGLAPNRWALAGEWSVEAEAVLLEASGGTLAYRFLARDVNLVLTPPATGAGVRFTVSVDGRPPGDDHGVDVTDEGAGTVTEPRLYQLVRVRGPVRKRTVEVRFDDPGVRAYVLTFG
jgi:hypothetical protein